MSIRNSAVTLVLVMIMILTAAVPAAATGTDGADAAAELTAMPRVLTVDDPITVIVNGVTLELDQPPAVEFGRTLVPFRAIFAALGAEVEWRDATRTVAAKWEGNSLSMKIDDYQVTMGDGRVIYMSVPARIINGRTLVPVRVISEAMGANVGWDEMTRTVTVDKTWDFRYVSNVGTLIAALGPNTRVQIVPGTYDISTWLEGMYRSGTWQAISDRYPNISVAEKNKHLYIAVENGDDLWLETAGAGKVILKGDSPDIKVIDFSKCKNITGAETVTFK